MTRLPDENYVFAKDPTNRGRFSMLLTYLIKSMIKNQALWGWSVLFMAFWLFLGAYVFTQSVGTESDWAIYTSSWFAIIGLIAGSVIATPISFSTYFASPSLAYGFRYTNLKPSSYLSSLMLSTAIMSVIVGSIISVLTIVLFSARSGFTIYPSAPWTVIGIFFLSGTFMLLLSVTLVVFVNNYLGLKNVSFIAFVPQLLSYIFGLSQVGIPLPSFLVYATPFSDIARLLYLGWHGSPSPMNFVSDSGGFANSYGLLAFLILWIGILFLTSIALLKRIRSTFMEEARQV